MRVNRLSSVIVYRRVRDLVIATVDQYEGEENGRFTRRTTDFKVVP